MQVSSHCRGVQKEYVSWPYRPQGYSQDNSYDIEVGSGDKRSGWIIFDEIEVSGTERHISKFFPEFSKGGKNVLRDKRSKFTGHYWGRWDRFQILGFAIKKCSNDSSQDNRRANSFSFLFRKIADKQQIL